MWDLHTCSSHSTCVPVPFMLKWGSASVWRSKHACLIVQSIPVGGYILTGGMHSRWVESANTVDDDICVIRRNIADPSGETMNLPSHMSFMDVKSIIINHKIIIILLTMKSLFIMLVGVSTCYCVYPLLLRSHASVCKQAAHYVTTCLETKSILN